MALAYGDFHGLSHQLRFLLFEIGIGLRQHAIEYFITEAHRQCLYRLQRAATIEGLVQNTIISHHIHDFLDQLQSQLKHNDPASIFLNWRALRLELDETIANEAMAQAYRQCWQQELKNQARGFTRFWDWLSQKLQPYEQLQLLEQWGCLGHPDHPNFRAKIGFSRREVLQYSPEFNACVSLHWCAIHHRYAYLSPQAKNYNSLIKKQFPQEYFNWEKQLSFKHQDPNDYLPLPLHPWQWRNQIQTQFSSFIDKKEIILLPHHQLTKPSMSFRTMMPMGGTSCHLKLATAVHTTSAMRTISPASIDNGPAVSSWLNALLAKHQHYHQSLFIAADLAGLRFEHEDSHYDQYKHLAVILRQNPLEIINKGQQIVPLGALFALSPLSNLPLLTEIIGASGLLPSDYFRRYCVCVLSGQLHLMLRYGVAFEAHQQNTLLIFTDNQPSAVVIRDFGNICVCMHECYKHDLKPDFHPDSAIVTNNVTELCDKFVHGNLRSNFAYWIKCLCQHYGLNSHDLWQLVRWEIQKILTTIAPDIDPQLFELQRHHLLSKSWQHKALLTMRLHKERYDGLSVAVTNPLSHCHE
ncbi:siderophore biosynthetic protein, iron repressed FrgA [Legionella lansingensis]|uniref:FrgA protein n=1 Tax=Legionella lansingensis TaxID=45067 RepID=A0A0W0VR46_9GAMM|nr:IucA/IucC family protein [Legionella lansingensis]KTD22663.1 FrgA protein [Legionella lansingensis]SNV55779.1 siderophore biosynthetic protein, iron repressed FrgA [Legionella lansingensis]